MNSFLGISYDGWHLVIAAALTVLVFITLVIFVDPVQFAFTLAFFLSAFLVSYLQALNESIQAIDPDLIKKYRSYKNFQIDSREDWKNTIIGWLVGIFLGTIIFILINKAFM